MKERYKELDLIKGIGILLVYLGHSFNLHILEWNKLFYIFIGQLIVFICHYFYIWVAF